MVCGSTADHERTILALKAHRDLQDGHHNVMHVDRHHNVDRHHSDP